MSAAPHLRHASSSSISFASISEVDMTFDYDALIAAAEARYPYLAVVTIETSDWSRLRYQVDTDPDMMVFAIRQKGYQQVVDVGCLSARARDAFEEFWNDRTDEA
jgi:hypothetical protein